MPRLLLVDDNPLRSVAHQRALITAGHEVTVAPSGAFALTTLEQARPDVIICWLRVEDMPASELCAIVRSDPMTRSIPFLLLTGRCPSSPEAVAQAVAQLPPPEPVSTSAHPADGSPETGAVSRSADRQGADPASCPPVLEALQSTGLSDAIREVSGGKKTGRLMARLGATKGVLVFRAGRLVHAEFQGKRGEAAVMNLLEAEVNAPDGCYQFLPWDGSEVPRRTWAADPGAEHLLRGGCAAIEMAQIAAGHPPPSPEAAAPALTG